MHVERLVRRNRPRRRCPDHDVAFLRHRHAKCRAQFIVLGKRKTHVNRQIGFVLVFHFRLGQRRFAVKTPVHRFQTAIDVAFVQNFAQRTDFVRFVGKIHGFVRIVPLAQYAQTHKVHFLRLDLLSSVSAGFFLHLTRGQTTPVDGLDFVLNRHAVTIPARYIRCIKARHRARFDDDVLENFVHRVTDVNVTVRIRRAVVQNEFRTVLLGSDLTNFVIAFLLMPLRDPLRFAFGQITTHRKRRVQ